MILSHPENFLSVCRLNPGLHPLNPDSKIVLSPLSPREAIATFKPSSKIGQPIFPYPTSVQSNQLNISSARYKFSTIQIKRQKIYTPTTYLNNDTADFIKREVRLEQAKCPRYNSHNHHLQDYPKFSQKLFLRF